MTKIKTRVENMANKINVSVEAYVFLRDIQREHKAKTHKHKEFSVILDELIEKVKNCDEKDKSQNIVRRNLKPIIGKFK